MFNFISEFLVNTTTKNPSPPSKQEYEQIKPTATTITTTEPPLSMNNETHIDGSSGA